MPTPWISNVTQVSDGEVVNQAVTNRAIRQLTQRTQYLKEVVGDGTQASGVLSYSGVPIDSGVSNGTWVYRDDSTGIHKKALFTIEDSGAGVASMSASSAVVGIVISAANMSDATILVAGASIKPSDVGVASWQPLCVSTETFVPGFYFLSDIEPGKMTRASTASSIALGWFSYSWARVLPQYSDPLIQHRHDSFVLHNRPASYSRYPSILAPAGFTPDFSNGDWTCWYANYWTTEEASYSAVPDPEGDISLNFYNEVQLSLKFEFGLPPTPVRLKITPLNDPVTQLRIEVHGFTSGSSPDSYGIPILTKTIVLPAWGAWIEVAEASVWFSLVSVAKSPTRYTNPLQTALDHVAGTSGCWYAIIDRTDFRSSCYGWTNANPADTPGDIIPRYRYLHETDSSLDSYYPSTAFESWVLAVDGIVSHPNELRPYGSLLSWGVGTHPIKGVVAPLTQLVAPFAYEFASDPVDPQSLSSDHFEGLWANGILYSSNPMERGSQTLVSKLITRCPALTVTGWNNLTPANRGELALDFRPTVAIATEGSSALSGWTPETGSFTETGVVSRVRAGRSILIEKVDSGGVLTADQSEPFTGPVRISLAPNAVGSEVSLVALENAKESRVGPCTYIEFPPLSEAASAVTARLTVPHDLTGTNPSLAVLFTGLFFGEVNNSLTTTQQAVLKVDAWIMRKGLTLESSASTTEAWRLVFAPGYAGMSLLPLTVPVDGTTISKSPSVPYTVPGVQGGDVVILRITREANSSEFTVSRTPLSGTVVNGYGPETYLGSIGMLSLGWEIYALP